MLINYSEVFIYAGLFFILFMCGLGFPIPEEVTLLAGGFLINLGFIRFYPTLGVVFIGILAGDLTMYSIGRKWGHGIITHRFLHQIFSEKRLAWVRQFFCDHGSKTILIARFISGFRVAAFLAAGTMVPFGCDPRRSDRDAGRAPGMNIMRSVTNCRPIAHPVY